MAGEPLTFRCLYLTLILIYLTYDLILRFLGFLIEVIDLLLQLLMFVVAVAFVLVLIIRGKEYIYSSTGSLESSGSLVFV